MGSRLIVAAVVAAAACRTPRPAPRTVPAALTQPAAAPAETEERHEVAMGDVISIKFPHRAEFNEEVLVRNDGRIALPVIGTVRAAGLTPEELEAELRPRYASAAYRPSVPSPDKHYLLNVHDVLEIRFQHTPSLNATVQIRPDGRISLDLIKTVVAEGKTPEALEAELTDRYAEHLQDADLVVVVKEYTSELVSVNGQLSRPGPRDIEDPTVIVRTYAPRQVYVAGEVRAPGFVPYRPALTAMQAVITVGGLLNSAAGDRILLLRKSGVTQPSAEVVDLTPDFKGRGHNDVTLRPFDMVIVPKTRIASIAQALDQYVYQLVPATRNVNFTFFYDVAGMRIP